MFNVVSAVPDFRHTLELSRAFRIIRPNGSRRMLLKDAFPSPLP